MPQKLNKAGKMQDYIPKGNGDASGEYGTSNGTNKNFTTSDKKKTEANVITENKSVVVGDKGKTKEEYNLIPSKDLKIVDLSGKRIKGDDGKEYEIKEGTYGIEHNGKLVSKNSRSSGGSNIPMGYDKKTIEDIVNQGLVEEETAYIDEGFDKEQRDRWEKSGYEAKAKPRETKANVIDNDLTGKKEETLVDEKTQKEINDRISGWDNKMRYMMLSRMQSDVKYYLGAGGRSKRDLWAQDEKEHIAYMETLYNGLKEKPEWLSKKELENYKKELLKK